MPTLLSYCKNTVALILSALFVISCNAEASELRGRVEATHRYASKAFSVSRAIVIIYRHDRNLTEVQRTITGSDGMYYFRDIDLGEYVIKVESSYGSSDKEITVHNDSRQDIPLIHIVQ